MHGAVVYNQTEIVKLLLAKGADAISRDCGGQTLIHYALINQNPQPTYSIIKMLLAAGAPIDELDKHLANARNVPLIDMLQQASSAKNE